MDVLKVGFPLYEGFDSLDVLGPFQTFTLAGMDCYLVAQESSPVKSFEGVHIVPRTTFKNCPPLDMLFVPGGATPVEVLLKGHLGQNCYLDFLVEKATGATGTKWVCSVCTGALLLAGAGLLNGLEATTHWAYKDVLRLFPCRVVDDYPRYVRSGNRITGGGISSGLDESLYIVSLLYGDEDARRCQLAMQYNPHPAFHAGDPGDTDIKDDRTMVEEWKKLWHVADAISDVTNWLAK